MNRRLGSIYGKQSVTETGLSVFEVVITTNLRKEENEKSRIDFDCVKCCFGLPPAGPGKKV